MSVMRADRIGDRMKRELGDLLRGSVKDPRIPLCTGVTRVDVTRDLSHATAYISVLGSREEQEACLQALVRATGFLRRELAGRIRIHHSPELHFQLDNSVQEGLRMARVIDAALAADERMRAEAGVAAATDSADRDTTPETADAGDAAAPAAVDPAAPTANRKEAD